MVSAASAAPTSRARCRSTPSTATARWPSSTPATLSSCGSEAARSSPAGPPKGGVYRPRDGQEAACGQRYCLRVIAVSHPWQQPDHPDPKEVNLTLFAKVLERFIEGKGSYEGGGGTYACFFDFMSCFQKGPDGKRTDKEMALFGKALSNMMVWCRHPTLTFKLTRLPKGYRMASNSRKA